MLSGESYDKTLIIRKTHRLASLARRLDFGSSNVRRDNTGFQEEISKFLQLAGGRVGE